jgi:hypothetical protein
MLGCVWSVGLHIGFCWQHDVLLCVAFGLLCPNRDNDVHGGAVSKEYTLEQIGISGSGASFGMSCCDFGTKGNETVKTSYPTSPCLVWSLLDGLEVGTIVEPDCMWECVAPKFDSKASCV